MTSSCRTWLLAYYLSDLGSWHILIWTWLLTHSYWDLILDTFLFELDSSHILTLLAASKLGNSKFHWIPLTLQTFLLSLNFWHICIWTWLLTFSYSNSTIDAFLFYWRCRNWKTPSSMEFHWLFKHSYSDLTFDIFVFGLDSWHILIRTWLLAHCYSDLYYWHIFIHF